MFPCMSKRTIQRASDLWMTPQQAASATGLTPSWLARMADEGKLTAARPGGTRSHRRYLRAEIDALAPLPEARK